MTFSISVGVSEFDDCLDIYPCKIYQLCSLLSADCSAFAYSEEVWRSQVSTGTERVWPFSISAKSWAKWAPQGTLDMTFSARNYTCWLAWLIFIGWNICLAPQLSEVVRKTEEELQEAKASTKEKQLSYDKFVSNVKSLEKLIKEYGDSRESRLNDLDKKIKATKAQIQLSLKDLKVIWVLYFYVYITL